MIVQITFKYSINLDRILYAELDSDLEDHLKIVFDNGAVLQLKGAEEINSFDKHTLHNDMASTK